MRTKLINFRYYFDDKLSLSSCRLDILNKLKHHIRREYNTIFLCGVDKFDEYQYLELFPLYSRDVVFRSDLYMYNILYYSPKGIHIELEFLKGFVIPKSFVFLYKRSYTSSVKKFVEEVVNIEKINGEFQFLI